jgi:hypothetical protein
VESQQPPACRRLLKSGKILLGKHPVLAQFAIIQRPVLACRFRPWPAFQWSSTSSREVIQLEHARRSGVTIPRSESSSFKRGVAIANRSVIRPLHDQVSAMSRIGRRRRTGRCQYPPGTVTSSDALHGCIVRDLVATCTAIGSHMSRPARLPRPSS